jgi:hypothetical protein
MKTAIVAVILAICVYFYGHHKGWGERDAEMQTEIATKNEEARTKEHELQKQLNNQTSQLMEANNAITEKQSALDRAIRSGRMRLPASSCVQSSSSTGPAPSNRPEAATESDTETLRLIAQIAADGDRAIVQLNACIDAYNQVKDTINGKP